MLQDKPRLTILTPVAIDCSATKSSFPEHAFKLCATEPHEGIIGPAVRFFHLACPIALLQAVDETAVRTMSYKQGAIS
jgi:hypothetical protein